MEAKDTVMSDERMMDLERGLDRASADHALCKAQAEISFKAGQDENAKQYDEWIQRVVVPDSKKAGRKEVVKKLETWSQSGRHLVSVEAIKELKEWGIDQ